MSRNIDALVAEKVMGGFGMTPFRCPKCGGRKWGSSKLPGEEFVAHCHSAYCRWSGPRDGTTVPLYSTDPAAAMQVVEKMRELRFSVDIDTYTSSTEGEPWTVAFMRSTPDGKDWDASATKTAAMFPLAACLAALSALGVETKGEERGA